MKNLSILGSTGSIGKNVLKIVEMFPERFSVQALAAGRNVLLLAEQVKTFQPEIAAVLDSRLAKELKKRLPDDAGVEILHGDDGYRAVAGFEASDMVVSAMVGAAGLVPTITAIEAGKDIALANKETLVMAGDVVMSLATLKGVSILPVDSEHSAIFQSISGQRPEDISKILLTASGGPFLNRPAKAFSTIKPEDALAHPTWDMGKKITIDSATLMNKGLEVIEARYLFDISEENIEVLIHPQSIVHSMVAYRDGSIIAQLGIPDMKGAIAYAMSFPERLPLNQPLPDFFDINSLTFQQPDMKKFPCLKLAFDACREGGTLPAVMNAANEVAVQAFLDGKLAFDRIPSIIGKIMEKHVNVSEPGLSDITEVDQWAREEAGRGIK